MKTLYSYIFYKVSINTGNLCFLSLTVTVDLSDIYLLPKLKFLVHPINNTSPKMIHDKSQFICCHFYIVILFSI